MSLDDLIRRHLDGIATSAEAAELDRLLKDPAAADRFAELSRRDQAFQRHFQEEAAAGRFRAAVPRRRLWAAAAALVAAAVLYLVFGREQVHRGPHVLRWDDGSSITLLAGAEAVVLDDDPKIVELRTGELEADVAPQKSPMVLRTPEAEAVVLGTKFRLSAARLEVTEGRVRMTRRSDGAAVDVGPGQVARAEAMKAVPVEVDRFLALYRDLHRPANGYFSRDGVPFHSIETLIVDAPDHGHLTTSETFSYWLWLEAAYGRISGDWAPYRAAWRKMEEIAIPGPADQPGLRFYDPAKPMTAMPERERIEEYPVAGDPSIPVGVDPLAAPELYVMHWLIDADNVYGFGRRGDRTSRNGFVNTFQRGPGESVWETIPHPSWDDFRQGGPNGYVDLFVKSDARQWRYVCAPDADARAIQAAYWAQTWAPPGTELPLKEAARMGASLRYALHDKRFRGEHGLIGWAFGWGGSLDEKNGWGWRSGAGQAHFGYQNPMAAWALAKDSPAWARSLEKQLALYADLQSPEGAIAGGYTIDGTALSFDPHPVFRDPPSNEWFGWQAWSMDRLAQYLHTSGDVRARPIVEKWAAWVKRVVRLTPEGYAIPATLAWSGRNVRVTGETEDVGIAAATARALASWAAAAKDVEARDLAKALLERIWRRHRDDRGVSNPEPRADYARFHEKLHVPGGWKGPLRPGTTFLESRPWFRRDPDWPRVEASLRRGEPPPFRYHRFWAQVEVAVANAEFARLFAP